MAFLCPAVLFLSTCQSHHEGAGAARETVSPHRAPDRAAGPERLILAAGPLRNPLNLYDVGIAGSPDPYTVGAVDGVAISTLDLESQSIGALGRIAARIYEARDQAYLWWVQQRALDRAARRAGTELYDFLRTDFAAMRAPTAAELAAIKAQHLVATLPEDELVAAARSWWRLRQWQQRRAYLVAHELQSMSHGRRRQRISDPAFADPGTVVAEVDGTRLDRQGLRALAGFRAMAAQREYHRVLKTQFNKFVDRFLRAREAQHLDIPTARLEQLYARDLPPISDEEVRAFIAREPVYAQDPKGSARARDVLRRLREQEAGARLDRELRKTTSAKWWLQEPTFERFAIDIPQPRQLGPPAAPLTLYALHSLGCRNCARGSQLLLSLMARFEGRLKIIAGDYFTRNRLASYRGALALRCAAEQNGAETLLRSLASDFGDGQIAQLTTRASAAGLPTAAFKACLHADRHLPVIVENVLLAERLGLERNVPGLFANGVRLDELGDLEGLIQKIRAASNLPPMP